MLMLLVAHHMISGSALSGFDWSRLDFIQSEVASTHLLSIVENGRPAGAVHLGVVGVKVSRQAVRDFRSVE